MDRIIDSKRKRIYVHIYIFLMMTLTILGSMKLLLDYLDSGFIQLTLFTYIIMCIGSFIYQSMFISIFKICKSIGKDRVNLFTRSVLLALILILSAAIGTAIFRIELNLSMSIYIVTFVFVGAILWDVCTNQMLDIIEELENREIKIVIKSNN